MASMMLAEEGPVAGLIAGPAGVHGIGALAVADGVGVVAIGPIGAAFGGLRVVGAAFGARGLLGPVEGPWLSLTTTLAGTPIGKAGDAL